MYWECRWRGYSEMADQAQKHPLKLFNLAQIFTGYSIYTAVNEIALVSGPQGRY